MPPNRRFEILPRAHQDIAEILEFTGRTWDANRVYAYSELLWDAFLKIETNPEIGVARPDLDDNLHHLPVGTHIIFYYLYPGSIEIARVLHQRMDARRFAED